MACTARACRRCTSALSLATAQHSPTGERKVTQRRQKKTTLGLPHSSENAERSGQAVVLLKPHAPPHPAPCTLHSHTHPPSSVRRLGPNWCLPLAGLMTRSARFSLATPRRPILFGQWLPASAPDLACSAEGTVPRGCGRTRQLCRHPSSLPASCFSTLSLVKVVDCCCCRCFLCLFL